MHKKKRKIYTDKKHAVKGIVATVLAVAALIVFAVIIYISFKHGGEADMRVGSLALISILLGLVGLVLGLMSFRNENSYKLFAQIGSFLNVFVLLLWGLIYMIGF